MQLILDALVGSVSGFAAAALYINSNHKSMQKVALDLRRAARRLESSQRVES